MIIAKAQITKKQNEEEELRAKKKAEIDAQTAEIEKQL